VEAAPGKRPGKLARSTPLAPVPGLSIAR